MTTSPLSLQAAMGLAMENIVARLDREQNWRPFFRVDLSPPARAVHASWDCVDMAGRYVDALALVRQVTGLSDPEAEAGIRGYLLSSANPQDGLFYNAAGPDGPYAADMFCQSRALIGLCTWFMDTGDEEVLGCLRRLVHGLISIAERRDDYVLYPRNLYANGEWLEGGLFYTPKDLWTVRPGYGGTQLEGMMRYHALTGDEAALVFAASYLRYFLHAAQVVAEDGSYAGHLHSQGIVPTMVGAQMLAEATGDRELIGLCGRFLRFTLSHCSSFGWVPDGIGTPTCETCALGDVIHLAIRLSRAGEGDYWSVVERFARNQLLANQFTDADRVLAGRDPAPGAAEIVQGSFASWARPNDLLGGPDLEGCCTGGGVRGLFHVLSNTVAREPDGTVVVRMLLPVETSFARVESELPAAGRASVRLQKRGRLRVHLPEGAAYRDVAAWLGVAPVFARSDGAWLVFDDIPERTTLRLQFPAADAVRREEVAGEEYTVTWRGNMVLGLEPAGTGYPAYR